MRVTFARALAQLSYAVGLITLALTAQGVHAQVTNVNTAEVFASINAAISDTDTLPGHTIVVASGTYVENVILNKSLTLMGAQAGVDARGRVVGAPNPGVESIIAPAAGRGVELQSGCAGSTIDGFSIVGGTRGIESTTGPLNNVTIRNNHITGQSGGCMFINDSGTDITIHRNSLLSTQTGGDAALHLDTDSFPGFHLTANDIIRAGLPANTGWFVDGNRNVNPSVNRNPLISQNVFRNHSVGSNIGTRALLTASITDNTWEANAANGLQGGPKDCTIASNRFMNNGGHGLRLTSFGNAAVDRGAQNCTVTGNQFLNNGQTIVNGAGVFFEATQAPGTISTNSVTNNFIIGNVIGARYTGAETINMENNWWSNGAGPRDLVGTNPADNITCPADPINASSLGDLVDGSGIDYCPWNESIGAITINAPGPCANVGSTVSVTINVTGLEKGAAGGQFFLSYNNAVLDFVSAVAGTGDFTLEIGEFVDEPNGTIDYIVGIDPGDPPAFANQTMATLTFNVLQNVCSTANLVTFRAHSPPSRLSNPYGQPLYLSLANLGAITLDNTPPVITAPADAVVECDPSDTNALPGLLLGTAVGGVEIKYNTGQPEVPGQQAYLKTQFSKLNANGAAFSFDIALLPPYNIPFLSWATLFGQVPPGQFGFDMVLPAPTWDGMTPIPPLVAVENTNSLCGGVIPAGPVFWAINDYKPNVGGPSDPTNCYVNSLFRSAGLSPTAVTVTKNILTVSGTVYTVQIGGILQTDMFIHWFNPLTPNSPVSNFGLTGKFFFDGTLTYNSAGDPGNDGDFYAGTITISANSPFTGANAVGIATVSDNCTALPLVTYSDVVTPGSCPQEKTIVRTWTAVDSCGNMSSDVQNITVQDTQPPVFTSCPANVVVNADVGGCDAYVSVPSATAVDCCDSSIALTAVRSDNALLTLADPFPSGVTTITWTATDDCGNSSQCVHTVTVNAVNTMVVDIELAGTFSTSVTRCIRFELFKCGGGPAVVVDRNVAFINGMASGVVLSIPCGDYDCITARDRKHTLRRTDSGFGTIGPNYVADFTGPDALVSGNLNDDTYIDILDFGVFAGVYLTNYGTGDTVCGPLGVNADLTGDGVVFTGDFTFIQQNFLKAHEANCCGLPGFAGAVFDGPAARSPQVDGPVTSIAVKELYRRGLGELAVGDVNHDGWLNQADIAEFMQGNAP